MLKKSSGANSDSNNQDQSSIIRLFATEEIFNKFQNVNYYKNIGKPLRLE